MTHESVKQQTVDFYVARVCPTRAGGLRVLRTARMCTPARSRNARH